MSKRSKICPWAVCLLDQVKIGPRNSKSVKEAFKINWKNFLLLVWEGSESPPKFSLKRRIQLKYPTNNQGLEWGKKWDWKTIRSCQRIIWDYQWGDA